MMKVFGIAINILLVVVLGPAPLLGTSSVVNAATPSPPAASPTIIEPAGNDKTNEKELNLRRRTANGGQPVILPLPPSAEPSAQPSLGPHWEEITYDDFENGWGNFKEFASPSDANDAILMSDASDSNQQQYVKQGNAALRIRDNKGIDSSVFHKQNHDVTGYSQLRVSFWFAPRSMEQGEDFVLEYSADGTTAGSWTEVKQYIRGPDDGQTDPGEFYFQENGPNVFYFDSVVLDGTIYDLETTKARIRFRCDASGDGDYVYIDKVTFSGFVDSMPSSAPSSTPMPSISFMPSVSIQPSAVPSGLPSVAPSWGGGSIVPSQPSAEPSLEPSAQPTDGTWEQITYDNFESGWGNFTQVDNSIAIDKRDAIRMSNVASSQQDYVHEGNAALRIRDNASEESSVWLKEDVDVTTYANLRVGFWFCARNLAIQEKFLLEYSSNGGASWIVLKLYIRDGSQVAFSNNDVFFFDKNNEFYYNVAFLDGTSLNLDTTQARIRFRSEVNDDEYIYIDEVSVEGQLRAN